jgi:hypothetical protein
MMSPRLTPTWNTIRCSSGAERLRSAIPRCTATAQAAASTTLGFDQDAIAGRLDDATLVLGDPGVDEFAAMASKPRESASLVLAHEPAIPGHIGGEKAVSRRSTRSPLKCFLPGGDPPVVRSALRFKTPQSAPPVRPGQPRSALPSDGRTARPNRKPTTLFVGHENL